LLKGTVNNHSNNYYSNTATYNKTNQITQKENWWGIGTNKITDGEYRKTTEWEYGIDWKFVAWISAN
jgi:hypothetical protein